MEKRTGVVTFAGGPITLVGPEIKVGQQAPDFTVLSNDLQAKTLKDFEGKVKLSPLFLPLIQAFVMLKLVGSTKMLQHFLMML